jgi:hypothetical protein
MAHLVGCCVCVCFVFCAPTDDQTTVPFLGGVEIFSSFIIIGVHLLVGQGRYSDPTLSTLKILNTRFAWAGGTCPRFAWAGGIFSPVILLCQFLVLAGNRFWFYILLMYLGYRTIGGVVLFFVLFWQEIVFGVKYVLSNLY